MALLDLTQAKFSKTAAFFLNSFGGKIGKGLTTLVSSSWNFGGFTKASQSLQDREVKISAIYEKMEDNLELVGAIGVEDKLQDGVKDTLVALGQAGIKVSLHCKCLQGFTGCL